MVPRNRHPGVPLRTACATVLSWCDAEFALRVDLPCLFQICRGLSPWRAPSTQKEPRATLHDYHCRREEVNSPDCSRTTVLVFAQGRQRSLRKFLDVPAALRIVDSHAARCQIAGASLLFPAKLGEKIPLRQLKQRV